MAIKLNYDQALDRKTKAGLAGKLRQAEAQHGSMCTGNGSAINALAILSPKLADVAGKESIQLSRASAPKACTHQAFVTLPTGGARCAPAAGYAAEFIREFALAAFQSDLGPHAAVGWARTAAGPLASVFCPIVGKGKAQPARKPRSKPRSKPRREPRYRAWH